MKLISFIYLIYAVSLMASSQVVYTPCGQDTNRKCSTNSNQTDFLLSMKKGGTNVLSTSTYLYDFFLCEEYNYDCGYVPEKDSFTTIANGVDLNMTQTELDAITTNNSTYDLIKPYLKTQGDRAVCGLSLFPLNLTPQQSQQVLDGYISQLVSNMTTKYNLDRNASSTKTWSQININIRTAVIQKLKANKWMIGNSTFWTNLCQNNFAQLSAELKNQYQANNDQIDLHAAYLIDSVTQECDKQQSINFLIDQSGSVGPSNFDLAMNFTKEYVMQTKDNLQKMSIHFYSTTFQQYINFGNNYSSIMSKLNSKIYQAGYTYTGDAINQTVSRINAQSFPKGLPKILVILTDGGSTDSITGSVQNMVSKDIYPIAVGIGSGTNVTQLLQIAQSPSNYIQVNTFQDLPKLVEFISNFFCKQIKTIRINQTIEGNYVRVPTSPSFFRVEKSPVTQGQVYQLDITFEEDPEQHNQSIAESQIDPFPDEFTQYVISENYEVYNTSLVAVPRKVYFIKPEQEIQYRVKKNINSTMNATVSYVSVRGSSMTFNISLKECETLKCEKEIQYYKSISKKNSTTPSVILIPADEDLSIFIIIGVTLGVIASLCALFILGCRKFNNDQEQKNEREILPAETLPTNQNIEQTLFPAHSSNKMSSAKKKDEKKSVKNSSSRQQSSENSSEES